MSFLKTLETIGKDIATGAEIAAPIVGDFVPAAGPILAEVAAIIAKLESSSKASTITPANVSQIIQATALLSTVKQATP